MTRLCRLFGVTRPGYYAWRQRPVSTRQRQDRVILEEMRVIFEHSGGTYGSPRLHQALPHVATGSVVDGWNGSCARAGCAHAWCGSIGARPAPIDGSANIRIV